MSRRLGAFGELPKLVIGGVEIARLDRSDTADLMIAVAGLADRNRPPPLFTSANGEVLSRCSRDPKTRQLFDSADVVSADGQPLVLASHWLSKMPLPERVATTDLFHDVAERADKIGLTFAFYGASPGELEKAVHNVRERYSNIRIVAASHGYLSDRDETEFLTRTAQKRPDVLWLCLGTPREQELYFRKCEYLRGVGVVKTGGGLLNFLSGTNSRAPLLWQRAGFEWLYRLLLEPRRLFWRYALTNPHCALLLLTKRIRSV